ncbi:sodium:solute symporter family protein [Kozakia baliensis]|uniref:sodium:solute symporter family protein n=1 Tax=Kozakia baliensis TaxID=153496 RepID=UPI0013143962|nr:sodium:solute symporter [Kozakia baliensis]
MHSANKLLPLASVSLMTIAFLLVLLASFALALTSRQRGGDARAFFTAGGQLNTVLYFVLAVGETYSIGTVLGFPGGVYAKGSTLALWFVGYILLAFPVGFVLYPRLWRAGRACGAMTLPDLFRACFGSILLERVFALLLMLCLLPLGASQFIGLTTVLAQFDWTLPPDILLLGAALLTFLYIGISGLRAPAIVSLLKDFLVLVAIAAVAVAASLAWPNGAARPLKPALQPLPSLKGDSFVISTILVQALGFCVSPPTVASIFAAKSPLSIQRAQIFMPLYMALFPLLFIVAGYALTHTPQPPRPDATFLTAAKALLPSWGFGLTLAGAALSALVVLAGIGLALAAIVARNLVPHLNDTEQKRWGLVIVACYFVLSALGARHAGTLLTQLNTLFYLGVSQAVPGALAIAFDRPVSARRVGMGLAAGISIASVLKLGDIEIGGINPALPALLFNMLICFAPSAKKQ